jgi:DNA-binding NtrC family response regulator
MAGVLIVEDDIFIALDLEHILTSADFAVNGIASDRKAAMAMADQCSVALVDINLEDGATGPGIGSDLATLNGMKVIFVTSHPALVGDAAKFATSIITKPFRGDTVIEAVRSAYAALETDMPDDFGFMPAHIAASEISAES